MITDDLEPALYEYIGGIVRDLKGRCLQIDGTADHIHLLIRDSKTIADTKLIQEVKGGSSRWINENGSTPETFQWQAGYGWFSVGPNDVAAAKNYIEKQKEHHRTETFQDEFRKFLNKYDVEYDEKYVWD